MDKATPVQMRRSLESVEVMKAAGIRFVPMPAINDADHMRLIVQMMSRLEQIEQACEE